MKTQYILSHDMGTSSDKAVLVTMTGEIIDTAKVHYPMYHPSPGYAEQVPTDFWNAICESTKDILKTTGINADQIAGVTFSSQTQTLIAVDKEGHPLRRSLSWLDGRSAEILHEMLWTPPRIKGYNIFHLLRFLTITGGCPGHTGKDQVGKLLWLKRFEPEVFNQAYKFIDAKDFCIHKFTGNMVTSVDLAYLWWMLDSRKHKNQWHPGLCKLAGITPERLAEVKESAAIAGHITKAAAQATGLCEGTPVINGAGDLAMEALGSGALEEGELHISVGTSGWVAGHFRKRRIDIPHYTGCVGSAMPHKYFLAMAHQETVGICLEWLKEKILYHEDLLREEHNVHRIYEILDNLADKAGPGAGGLMFTPWMYGERCPLDDEHVRGGLYNLGLNHSREHLIRAVFEGIAFNLKWALITLENLYHPVDSLNIIGGGANSDIWCQIIADIMNRKIRRVKEPQIAGAKGAALLASMALGHIGSYEEIPQYIEVDKEFMPQPKLRLLYDRLFKEFKNIYKQNKKWYARMNGQKHETS